MSAVFIIICILIVIYYYYFHSKNIITNVYLFYKPGCHWCEEFMPEWSILENELPFHNVRAMKVNVSDANNKAFVSQFTIEGVPTIMFKDVKGKYETYSGDRTSKAILSDVHNRMV